MESNPTAVNQRGANMDKATGSSSDLFIQTEIVPTGVQAKSLAHEIGLRRIALVVDKLCNRLEANPELAEFFRIEGTPLGDRARLTYLWWVALGGHALPEVKLGVELSRLEAEPDFRMLREWINLFHHIAASLIEEELADSWMEEVSGLIYAATAANAACRPERVDAIMSRLDEGSGLRWFALPQRP